MYIINLSGIGGACSLVPSPIPMRFSELHMHAGKVFLLRATLKNWEWGWERGCWCIHDFTYLLMFLGMSPEEFANAEDWERQTWDKEKPKSKKVGPY